MIISQGRVKFDLSQLILEQHDEPQESSNVIDLTGEEYTELLYIFFFASKVKRRLYGWIKTTTLPGKRPVIC